MSASKNVLFLLPILALIFYSCHQSDQKSSVAINSADYTAKDYSIKVDGKFDDWDRVPSVEVKDEKNIWLGEGLLKGVWKGEEDLSFSWKAAHHEGKLFFLISVKDDTLSKFVQQYSWMNDCVEIHLDHQNLGGERIIGIGEKNTLEDRFGKRLRGHEMQFLPSSPEKVFYDDSKAVYYTDKPQTGQFKNEWNGEFISKRTADGYILEIGFAVPNFYAKSGQVMGIDLAVCDDDGSGRKSLLVYSGFKGAFWLTMDNFKKIKLE